MDGLRRPGPMCFDSNKAENWRVFKMEYEIYMEACYSTKSEKSKCMMLLNLAGRDAIELERSFVYTPGVPDENGDMTPGESREDLQCLLSKFDEICEPRRNTIMERHAFNMRFQRRRGEKVNGEILDAVEDTQRYIADLKTLAATCEFGELKDEFIRDRIVCGIINDKVRLQL